MEGVKQRKPRTRPPLEARLWLSPKDVGDLAGGVSPQYVREEIAAGRLKATVIPSRGKKRKRCRYRVHRDEARAFAARLGECSTGNSQATEVT